VADQTIYYTLSTIAQTLAGALAVLVAFVVLKLSALDGAIGNALYEIQSRHVAWDTIWAALGKSGMEGMDKATGDAIRDQRLRSIYSGAEAAMRTRAPIVTALSWAVAASVIDIALCFVALPLTPKLLECPPWASRAVWGAVGLGIVCLLLYSWLIFTVIRAPRSLPDPTNKADAPKK
jgi:hypothetical protein